MLDSQENFSDKNPVAENNPSMLTNINAVGTDGIPSLEGSKTCFPSIKSAGNIACITESRGSASEIGLTIFDINDSVLRVSQLLDTPTYLYTIKLLHQYCVQTVLHSLQFMLS
jgi:hypothetical protein